MITAAGRGPRMVRRMRYIVLFLMIVLCVAIWQTCSPYFPTIRWWTKREWPNIYQDPLLNVQNHQVLAVDQPLIIPGDEELKRSGMVQLMEIYWRYINSVQVLCNEQRRFGSLKDGGKEVCLDEPFKPTKHSCLVYSFGSNYRFDFEISVFDAFGCEIHTFDPSVNVEITKAVQPKMIQFHRKGLNGVDVTTKHGGTFNTLRTIIQELNHTQRTIDILKIDIEGFEWSSFREILSTNVTENVKQICIEVHFGQRYEQFMPVWEQIKILRQMHEAGFKIFQHEHNIAFVKKFPTVGEITLLNEISLLNMNLAR